MCMAYDVPLPPDQFLATNVSFRKYYISRMNKKAAILMIQFLFRIYFPFCVCVCVWIQLCEMKNCVVSRQLYTIQKSITYWQNERRKKKFLLLTVIIIIILYTNNHCHHHYRIINTANIFHFTVYCASDAFAYYLVFFKEKNLLF